MSRRPPDATELRLRASCPDCMAPGCGMPARGYSRYCDRHRARASYTGDPHGRILRTLKDLGPYFAMADKALSRYGKHPATVAAIAWCDDVLTKADNVGGRLGKELQRLQRDGATGPAMLRRILAVFGYAHFERRIWTSDLLTVCNVGHHALLTTPMPPKVAKRSGKAIAQQFPGSVALEFGRTIREILGMFCQQFWESVERDLHALERERAAVNQHLRENHL